MGITSLSYLRRVPVPALLSHRARQYISRREKWEMGKAPLFSVTHKCFCRPVSSHFTHQSCTLLKDSSLVTSYMRMNPMAPL